MIGEMHAEDIEKGGEYFETRVAMENLGKKSGLTIKVEPFDKYQGPQGVVYLGALNLGSLFLIGGVLGRLHGEGRWEFSPTMDVKLKHNIKPSKLTTEGMISFFKSLVKKFPSHDTFEVLKGDKPYHYQTPQLKKAQQKSLLKLVKSKYTIVVASRS